MLASRLAVALVAVAFALPAAAQVKPEQDPYQPTSGQAGKDVVWVPTPDALVKAMLLAVKTTKDDLVYDLGAGDGKIAIAAAKEYGAKSVGIEYNPEMAEFARRNVKREGVDNLVNIITGDIFVEDFSKATVVTMYLLPATQRQAATDDSQDEAGNAGDFARSSTWATGSRTSI